MADVLIIDDEKNARTNLANLIGHYCPKLNIKCSFGDPKEAIRYLTENEVDAIFLDIEMPGMSGFDFLEEIDYSNIQIVFVTAYSDYAIKAFKSNAIDYILKPIKIEDLEAAAQKIEERTSEQALISSQEVYLESLKNLLLNKNSHQPSSKITVPNTNGLKIVETAEITRILADGGYSHIHLANGKPLLVTRNIGHFEDVLDTQKFVRIHYSHLINLDYLSEFSHIDGGTAIMQDGNHILVAKRRLKEFKDKMKAYYG